MEGLRLDGGAVAPRLRGRKVWYSGAGLVERVVRDLGTYLRQPAPDRALTSGGAAVLLAETPTRELWST